ncbi:tRNA (adenosine(37)-N6)-threonylcarbamoyltransferase complex dimerization subunit type 1 TsaB [Ruminococcus sp. Marseille-P6503]|uniref:tRNA (adenosine(37)-N6)-threonylcarbamoyltransferase complex dimerization subunit type 1 TsaB n=1 Tax=Ruminococcus sp. Marseille-P6503 TaxID=2364796 RepID=UPI000F548DBB|nr:tRNA (adenosine(37)-N6)-threonylcarbamoyltransferase complex dimerization subunit type 1 TsaB [Ruminococcus sp. Marseille-P6503]
MTILGIDTSGKVASCAVMSGDKILCEKILYTKLTHSQVILPMVKEVMSGCELGWKDIDGIAVANGPGSYTGLRIGIAAVKGICMGAPGIRCAGISTLEALAYNCLAFQGRIIPVMKARPKVVYAGDYFSDRGKLVRLAEDRVAGEEEFFAALDTSEKIMLTGDHCAEIKKTYFAGSENVILAPAADRLQKASSLCAAFMNAPQYEAPPDKLMASYLQETKAEKDKAHR